MPKSSNPFAIDDIRNTSENLTAYAQVLEGIDATLGSTLSQYLASLASDQPPDTAAIWDALYAATAPEDPAPTDDGADGGNGTA